MDFLPFKEKLEYKLPSEFIPREWQNECFSDFQERLRSFQGPGNCFYLVCAGNCQMTLGNGGGSRLLDFSADMPEELANDLLRRAVQPGTPSRLEILRHATRACREQNRKLIIFVGGDSFSDQLATQDAEKILPAELESLGVPRSEILPITSNNTNAAHRMQEFGKSGAWIMPTVNMVSEGADIPELSAALSLTCITSKATTIQRIGRVLRGTGAASVFMFADKRYISLSKEIKHEIAAEFRLRRKREEHVFAQRSEPEIRWLKVWVDGATFNGKFYNRKQVEFAKSFLREKGVQQTPEMVGAHLMVTYGGLGRWGRLNHPICGVCRGRLGLAEPP